MLDLAGRQGYVTASDVAGLGVHRMQLARLVESGHLLRTVRGIYITTEDRTREERHVLVTRATLDQDPWSVASHHSAAAMQGIALYGVPFDQVQVADPRRSSRSHRALHRHVLREGDVVEEVAGYKAVHVPLALCQLAARFGVEAGLVAIDDALRRELCTPDDLTGLLETGRIRRGIGAARRAVALADARAESPGESRLRAIVAATPFSYEPQVNVGGPGDGYRVDLLVDGRLAVEFDGAQKYDGVDGKQALFAEKRREDWIRARGYGFLRVSWPELDHPVTLRRVIHEGVLRARATPAA